MDRQRGPQLRCRRRRRPLQQPAGHQQRPDHGQPGRARLCPGSAGWVDNGNGGGIWCAPAPSASVPSWATPCTGPRCTPRRSDEYAAAAAAPASCCTPNVVVANSILYANRIDEIAGPRTATTSFTAISSRLRVPRAGTDRGPRFIERGGWVNVRGPNVAVDPYEPDAAWVQGVYRLKMTSSLIDAGDRSYQPTPRLSLHLAGPDAEG